MRNWSHTDTGPDPHLATGRLTIDLDALTHNYRMLARTAAPAAVAGVVKANGYGLGVAPVARALWKAGCRTFFVALPQEGIALREVLPDAVVFVLAGPIGPEAASAFADYRLIPVLNSQSDISTWEGFGWDDEVPRPCAIHVDTGMNRLGLTVPEAVAFAEDNALTGAITPLLVMSHLACADQPDHPMNRQQLDAFMAIRQAFPRARSSLANSAGTFLGPDFACDLVRPGIALYGGAPVSGTVSAMWPVVTAEARILQIRYAAAGTTVSYGATQRLARDTAIAVCGGGYADGLHRALSGAGVPLRATGTAGGHGFLNGQPVPILGRVTMDLTLFDITDLGPDGASIGDHVELFGPNVPIDAAATAAGTISYELLTSLGRRFCRYYVGEDGTAAA